MIDTSNQNEEENTKVVNLASLKFSLNKKDKFGFTSPIVSTIIDPLHEDDLPQAEVFIRGYEIRSDEENPEKDKLDLVKNFDIVATEFNLDMRVTYSKLHSIALELD